MAWGRRGLAPMWVPSGPPAGMRLVFYWGFVNRIFSCWQNNNLEPLKPLKKTFTQNPKNLIAARAGRAGKGAGRPALTWDAEKLSAADEGPEAGVEAPGVPDVQRGTCGRRTGV